MTKTKGGGGGQERGGKRERGKKEKGTTRFLPSNGQTSCKGRKKKPWGRGKKKKKGMMIKTVMYMPGKKKKIKG